MINIRPCTPIDADIINAIAHKSWWHTYSDFINEEQIRFMLNEMFDPDLLSTNIQQGVGFLMAEIDEQAVGFISFVPKTNSSTIYRIEKLYLLEQAQGLGIGKTLINAVAEIATELRFKTLELNVNRDNSASSFYEKQGFNIVREVDIPYFQFVLNDYVMQKNI